MVLTFFFGVLIEGAVFVGLDDPARVSFAATFGGPAVWYASFAAAEEVLALSGLLAFVGVFGLIRGMLLSAFAKFRLALGRFFKNRIVACCLETPSLLCIARTSSCFLSSGQSLFPAVWSPVQCGHFMGLALQVVALWPVSLHLAHLVSPAQYFSPWKKLVHFLQI